MSRGYSRKILLGVVSLLVTLLLLVIAELVLRSVSPSPASGLVSEVVYDGITWYETNRGFLSKYFPAGSPSVPEFKTSLFRRDKLPGTFRVMCLGSSSMFGTPYDMNGNIPGIVRKQLRYLHPDREIEVINWGASAINSNVIRDFAPRLLAFQPDLVLIYMGHNEFYGPDGVGAPWLERRIPSLTRVKYWARDLRLTQMLQVLLGKVVGTPDRKDAPNLMKQVSEGSLIALQSDDAERIFQHFEENLRAIVATFQSRAVPVIVGELSSNLMFPPFVSDSLHGIGSSKEVFDEILKQFAAGRGDSVLQMCDRYRQPDSTNAFIAYWGGRALLTLGRTSEARARLVAARDNDLLKFRAPARINVAIRSIAARSGIPLVPCDSLLGAVTSDGIPGDSLFWEHLHPTLRGYYVIANGFVDMIVTEHLVAGAIPVNVTSLLPFDPDSLSVCWLDRAYADLSIQHLTGRWPFQHYSRSADVLPAADPPLLQLVTEVYGRKLQWNEACYRSAALFWGRGQLTDARTTYEAMLEEYPYSFYTNYLLGSLLNHTGRQEASLLFYRRAITSNPQYARAWLDLGLMEVNRGNFGEAVSNLETVLKLEGDRGQKEVRANALYGLGAAYANMREFTKALARLDEALWLKPDYADAVRLRSEVVAAQRGEGVSAR